MSADQRLTIRLGPSLVALLESGNCAGPSIPKRLDLLAMRFQHIMSATKPPVWPVENWMAFITLALQTDLTQPGAIYALQGNAKALGEARLAFALDSLAPAQQILLMGIAEQYRHRFGKPDTVSLEQNLEQMGISVSTAQRV